MQIELELPVARLDLFLAERFPEVNRTRWGTWIREGHVIVSGVMASKPGTKLRPGDVVETEMPVIIVPALHLEPEKMDLPTLFEDERLWIIDKPAGMVVHPGPGHVSGTVLNALLGRLQRGWEVLPTVEEDVDEDVDVEEDEVEVEVEVEPNQGKEIFRAPWPGLVHRLDRYTTGCLAMTKDAEAQACLMAQFKIRSVQKYYLALVRNSPHLPQLGSLLVDEPIARHRTERVKMVIAAHGRASQTRVRVLARSSSLALVECKLLTGRTHQIRVHLAHLRAPIVGDGMYGGPSRWQDADKQPFERLHPTLHAWKLTLDHPDGRRIAVEAPLPEDFKLLLERLEIPIPV